MLVLYLSEVSFNIYRPHAVLMLINSVITQKSFTLQIFFIQLCLILMLLLLLIQCLFNCIGRVLGHVSKASFKEALGDSGMSLSEVL